MGNFGFYREIYGGSAREKNTCGGGLIDGGQVGELWVKGSKKGLFGDVFPFLGTFYLTYKYNGEIYGAFGAVD